MHAKDFEGWTPLHAAAHWSEKEACRILMEHKAKLSELTVTGQDVLRVADPSIVEYLEGLQEVCNCFLINDLFIFSNWARITQ